MLGQCKNCKYWDSSGECARVGYSGEINEPTGALFTIDITVADDHNLRVALKTSADFGCTEFDARDDSPCDPAEWAALVARARSMLVIGPPASDPPATA
jgi:hypothetical protein